MLEENNESQAPEVANSGRTRGRPRRPTAQKSVHQLVLNLTQSSEKKSQKESKRQKTTETTSETTPTTETTPTETRPTTPTTDALKWKVGQKVEARDVLGDWYSAKIVAVNDDQTQVLVHFERWSSRYDQWFPRDSQLIREKSATEDPNHAHGLSFALNEEVLARWTDNRSYPATVVQVLEAQKAVHVLFYDGYRKKVKVSQIEKMPKDFAGVRVPSLRPEFEVKADHNEFKCALPNCNKAFRKQSLLAQHLKHYHKSEDTESPPPAPEAPPAPPEEKPVVELSPEAKPTSRLKRKYVRRPLPSSAVRKSHRTTTTTTQSNVSSDALLFATTPTTLLTTVAPKETREVANTTLPFWDARTVAEIHEADPEELVNCVCDAREESGLMVQCECCLCWQHAHCMHFDGETDVPEDGYFCLSCLSPKNVRQSRRNAFLVNHALKSGKRPEFPFAVNWRDNEQRQTLAAIGSLLAQSLEVKEVLSGVKTTDDDAGDKLSSVATVLSQLEQRVSEMEAQQSVEPSQWTEAEIKREMALMSDDLTRLRRLT